MFGYKNVAGVAAIEHALSDVNSCSSDIYSVVHVRDLVNGAGVNSHPHLNLRMVLECLRDFQRTTRRLLEIFEEQQRHPIAGWQANEFVFRFGGAETISAPDDAV